MRGLLTETRDAIRVRQFSLATEKAYLSWIQRLIRFHDRRHPRELGKKAIEQFLTHLAVERKASPSTQNQALQAILFLYREVLELELPWLDDVVRAKTKRRIPVLLSRDEAVALLGHSSVQTTMIYTHVVRRGAYGVVSPLDLGN